MNWTANRVVCARWKTIALHTLESRHVVINIENAYRWSKTRKPFPCHPFAWRKSHVHPLPCSAFQSDVPRFPDCASSGSSFPPFLLKNSKSNNHWSVEKWQSRRKYPEQTIKSHHLHSQESAKICQLIQLIDWLPGRSVAPRRSPEEHKV